MEFLHGRDEQKSVLRISGVRVDPILSREGRGKLLNRLHCKNLANCSHYGTVEATEDSVLLYIPESNFIRAK
jgi:hypothetical protein